MRLFTVGPVMMYPETLEQSGKQLPYFRTAEFSETMLDSEMILKKLLGADEQYKVAFLTASGTGAMESIVSCAFTSKDNVLVVNGGGFGKRFTEICSVHGIPFNEIVPEKNKDLDEKDYSHFDGKGYKAILVNMDETSTGQLYDIKALSRFCKKNGMYLIVDAISAFLADPINMIEDGIDAVVISSQKALALEPGISAVVLSPRLYEERILKIKSPTYYLDLEHHIYDQKRGQTPFTPAVGTLLCLNTMLHSIESQGIENKIAETAELAKYFRKGLEELGIKIPNYNLSNAVTPVLFEGNAIEIYDTLRNVYDITVTPSGGELKECMLRVGHIGNVTKQDYDVLLSALKEIHT